MEHGTLELVESEHAELAQVMPETIPGKYGGYLKPITSSERAVELNRIRWEKHRAIAAEGVEEAGGWKAIVVARAKHAQTEKAGAAASAAFVGRAADLFTVHQREGAEGNGPTVSIHLDASAVAAMGAVLAKLGAGDK